MKLYTIAVLVALCAAAYAYRGRPREIPQPELFGQYGHSGHRGGYPIDNAQRGRSRMRGQNRGPANRNLYPGMFHRRQDPIPELYNMESEQEFESRHSVQSPCVQACPMNFQPVCGSNGQTYGNSCELNVAACRQRIRLYVTKQGQC